WETATAAVTMVAEAGLEALQSQYAWVGFVGLLGDAAMQSLAVAASSVVIPLEATNTARQDTINKLESLLALLEKYDLHKDANGDRFNFNAVELAEQLQASIDAQQGSEKSLRD